MNKLILGLILIAIGIAMSSAVYGLDEDQVPQIARQGGGYNITVGCTLNGWFCNNNTRCNVTVNSNSQIIINNQAMTISGANAVFSLNGTHTSALGRDFYNVKCNDPTTGLNGSTDGILYITTTGTLPSSVESVIWVMVAIVTIFLCLFFSFCFVKIPFKNPKDLVGRTIGVNWKKYIKILMFVLAYYSFLFLFWILWTIGNSFIFLSFGTDIFRIAFFFFFAIGLIMLIVGPIAFWVLWLADMKTQRMLSRGLFPR